MFLQGTLLNVFLIIAGTVVGRKAGSYLSDRIRRTLMSGVGLAVLLIGMKLALQSQQLIVVISSLIIGGLIGELIGIERRLESFGYMIQSRFSDKGTIAEGFVTASLLYCVGAMAIMGSLQEGMGGKPTILYSKAVLDGISAVALSSTLGIGVAFSILPVAIYQGSITLLAGLAKTVLTTPVITEMNAVGGLLIVAISLDLMGIKRLPVGNILPAIFVCIAILWGFGMA